MQILRLIWLVPLLILSVTSACSQDRTQAPLVTVFPTFTPLPLIPTLPPLATSTPQPTPTIIQPPILPEAGTPVQPVSGAGIYAVIGLEAGQEVLVFQAPGADQTISDRWQTANGTRAEIVSQVWILDELWLEVSRPSVGTGWVNAANFTERVEPEVFCADPNVNTVLEQLRSALNNRDGVLFSALVSPVHGLNLEILDQGTMANYSAEEARWVFESTYSVDWGLDPGSGLALQGTFDEVVLPKLLDVLNASYTSTCNQIMIGSASYTYDWPDAYRPINYYALYRSAQPGDDQNWRTWLAGIEYVAGKPVLFTLIQLSWEP